MHTKRFLLLIACLAFSLSLVPINVTSAQAARPVVVLSPGHGWLLNGQVDPGATNGDLVEKDLTLDVAKQAREFLSRCPVDVYLTRESDAPNTTLEDVDEIVNGHHPTVAVSIHVNENSPASGTEAWHTVGGYDDTESKRLSQLLADEIALRFGIENRGIKSENANRHGGLYIHWWNAPSSLVELAFIGGDAELLRERRRDFARAVAKAILDYLDVPAACADMAVSKTFALAIYFPGEQQTNQVSLQNDGLAIWDSGDYVLENSGETYGADASYALPASTTSGETVTWEIPATAPTTAGVYQQVWQLKRSGEVVGPEVSVVLIVVPKEAQELKERIERQIQEWREQGERELQKLLEDIQREIVEWVQREIERQIGCPPCAFIGLAVTALVWGRRRKGQGKE
jgi:N-acetylmuramoyl-L-alanine amidase